MAIAEPPTRAVETAGAETGSARLTDRSAADAARLATLIRRSAPHHLLQSASPMRLNASTSDGRAGRLESAEGSVKRRFSPVFASPRHFVACSIAAASLRSPCPKRRMVRQATCRSRIGEAWRIYHEIERILLLGGQRRTAAHLRPSGYAGSNQEARAGVRRLIDGQQWSRTNQRHFAANDVPQLRNLVQPRLADDLANPRGAPIARNDRARAVERSPNRAELIEQEPSPILPNALLPEDDRSAQVQGDDRGHNRRQWRQRGKQERSNDGFDRPPEAKVGRRRRNGGRRDRLSADDEVESNRNEIQRPRHQCALQSRLTVDFAQCEMRIGASGRQRVGDPNLVDANDPLNWLENCG